MYAHQDKLCSDDRTFDVLLVIRDVGHSLDALDDAVGGNILALTKEQEQAA